MEGHFSKNHFVKTEESSTIIKLGKLSWAIHFRIQENISLKNKNIQQRFYKEKKFRAYNEIVMFYNENMPPKVYKTDKNYELLFS